MRPHPQPNQAAQPPSGGPNWESEFKNRWITEGIDADCIKFAERFGKYLKFNDLTTSQIRNVFGELKRIQMKGFKKEESSFLLLKPKMAYAVKRHGKKGLEALRQVFDRAYDCVDCEQKFKNLVDFMEAILAFHKSYGGK